ncbi:SOUL family heme-binding protein [Thiorhodococcus fuscus]|uniref:SOUL family heme-binding protein n=1 Tax=Thiorhodococcus fuscus TaxID=527200 RepID=A0ABW4YDN2_9GAMM
MAVEEPNYTLVQSDPDFELRRYAPYLVAETRVTGDFDSVGNQAFRILAGYIFGDNRSQTKLEMTAPVTQTTAEGTGERLEMTAPVIQRSDGDGTSGTYVLSFVMPAGYRLDTLPVPTDPRVTLREEPSRLMAVRRYSGRWTRSNYLEQESRLLRGIRQAGLQPIGTPRYARYNPPFTPWFLRRNEVMVEVAEPSAP